MQFFSRSSGLTGGSDRIKKLVISLLTVAQLSGIVMPGIDTVIIVGI